ncbi:MAG TPA: hypothetical protein VF144_11755 [Chitinophagaceae bacterium]
MKKSIASILLILYVAFSSGVAINFHYCMDSFDSVQIGTSRSDYCGVCGMHNSEANECCRDEVRILKIEDDQQTSSFGFKFSSPDEIVAMLPVWNETGVDRSTHQLYSPTHSPPLSQQDTYLQNCVFRI